MTSGSNLPILEPDKKELETIIAELGSNGYYGWLKIKRQPNEKALLKAELWYLKNGTPNLEYKVILMYKIEDQKSFKETDLLGAFSGKGESIFSTIIEKLKETNVSTLGTMASQIFGQGSG